MTHAEQAFERPTGLGMAEEATEIVFEPKAMAAVELLGRTGASSFGVRSSDDEQPVVWIAVVGYGGRGWEAAAGHDPSEATLRLAEQLVDGGNCAHCHRPTALAMEHDETFPVPGHDCCWYAYDPELNTFRRGCEDPDG